MPLFRSEEGSKCCAMPAPLPLPPLHPRHCGDSCAPARAPMCLNYHPLTTKHGLFILFNHPLHCLNWFQSSPPPRPPIWQHRFPNRVCPCPNLYIYFNGHLYTNYSPVPDASQKYSESPQQEPHMCVRDRHSPTSGTQRDFYA